MAVSHNEKKTKGSGALKGKWGPAVAGAPLLSVFLYLAFGTSSLFYCAPTSAAAFSSSTPKHTLRKLMSHVNQARLEWPARRRSGWGQSGSSSSSLIMIHRHTARLIVYRSFTMPASQPANTPGSVDTRVPYICICVPFFQPEETFFTSFVILPLDVVARLPSFRCYLALCCTRAIRARIFVNYGSWFMSGLFALFLNSLRNSSSSFSHLLRNYVKLIF